MNCSTVHDPRPVGSGVRFAVKLTPQGPTKAVRSGDPRNPQPSGPRTPLGIAGSFASAGWPESRRVESGIGPAAVNTFGEWQSWHCPNSTRYSPRATFAASPSGGADRGPQAMRSTRLTSWANSTLQGRG